MKRLLLALFFFASFIGLMANDNIYDRLTTLENSESSIAHLEALFSKSLKGQKKEKALAILKKIRSLNDEIRKYLWKIQELPRKEKTGKYNANLDLVEVKRKYNEALEQLLKIKAIELGKLSPFIY